MSSSFYTRIRSSSLALTFLSGSFLAMPARSAGQAVVEDWLITSANAAATQNHWFTTANAGHAIDFISKSAAANPLGKDVVVVMAGEAANSVLQVLDAETGQHLNGQTMTGTLDDFRDHARMATSDDGFICVAGAGGTVQAYTLGGVPPYHLVHRSFYSVLSLPGGTTCRAFDVTGSLIGGTMRLFVGRGSHVVVFGNTPQSTTVFNYIGHFDTGVTGDVMALVESAGTVYASSVPSPAVRRFQLTYAPFQATGPTVMGSSFGGRVNSGLALDSAGLRAGVHLSSSGLGDEFSVNTVTGGSNPYFTNVPVLSSLDRVPNDIYDGGAGRLFLSSGGGTADVAMDPATGDVYGYCPGTQSGAIMKIRVSSSAVPDWNLY